jgi:dihydrodipicolinate synthase/N-acetylneuraminate lyase
MSDALSVPLVAFVPTPFSSGDGIDRDRLRDLASQVSASGFRPAVGFSTRQATDLGVRAARAGVDVLVVNPHYFAYPRPDGMAEHVGRIAGESGLRVVVYSSPTMPLTERHLECLVRVPGFHGVKETAVPPAQIHDQVKRWGDRIEWWGVGEVNGCAYVRAGTQVISSSFANINPAGSVAYVSAELAEPGSPDPALAQAIDEWHGLLAGAEEGYLAVLKTAMARLYGWSPHVRPPMTRAGEITQTRVHAYLDKYGA